MDRMELSSSTRMSDADFDSLAAQYLSMFPIGRMKLSGVLYICTVTVYLVIGWLNGNMLDCEERAFGR